MNNARLGFIFSELNWEDIEVISKLLRVIRNKIFSPVCSDACFAE
jgi:hypothetical protein